MPITKYEWFVRTDVYDHFELREELNRLNKTEFEIYNVRVIADHPEQNSVKATIIARKEII